MAKKDWVEVIDIFNKKSKTFIDNFLNSTATYCPSSQFLNIFDTNSNAFSAKILNKPKPGNWIPIYNRDDLSPYLLENNLMPIRCGQAEFFFFKGDVFFDLSTVEFLEKKLTDLTQIDDFIPLTLQDFHKNENAYLNKALAIGVINDFIDSKKLTVFKKQLNYRRLLYGQFGKIKTNFNLEFITKHGTKQINKGFQFEIDLVLENKDEIIIFEAKQGFVPKKTFSLLQLYYPLIYLNKITDNKKKIRTVFIDIISNDSEKEIYKLVEFEFVNFEFDNYKIVKNCKYV